MESKTLPKSNLDVWVPVVFGNGFYEVNSNGVIRKTTTKTELTINYADPYPRVTLHGKTFRVHKVVSEAFLGKCPDGCEVNHKDSNKRNNCIYNLEYVTHLKNMQLLSEHNGGHRHTHRKRSRKMKPTKVTIENGLPTITCSKCGHTSVTRVIKPIKCPNCGTKYVYEENEKKKCPECDSGNTYVLVSGKVVCRDCGYDERKETEKKP